jgi:hypothetical protein
MLISQALDVALFSKKLQLQKIPGAFLKFLVAGI